MTSVLDELKTNIDILSVQINSINKQLEILENEKNKFADITDNLMSKEELAELKQTKLAEKKEAEYEKRILENFEGLNYLKIKKSVLLDEYRKKIFTLAKDKIILEIIKKAKESFDNVQPDLSNAQKYLEILTGGKYAKINLDLEEINSQDNSINKKWKELSRGTKEQVYLALRLGYASNYTKDRTTMLPNGKADLPIIIDDAFVNFDEQRTKQSIKCLIEFAKTNQVLFFTCHSDIMQKYFQEAGRETGIDVNIINMENL
mgnify:CR=1 FL=1